jgi:hypothetical protein
VLSVDHADVGAPWWKTARYSFGEVADRAGQGHGDGS